MIAVTLSFIASGAVYLGIFAYQPLHNVDWKQKINGHIGEVISDNSSIYVANYSDHYSDNNPFQGNYSYSVYKIDSLTGKIEWISMPMLFRGYQSQFFNDGGPLGLKIWVHNRTLFAMDGDTSSFQFTQYRIYSLNITSGRVSGTQIISFPYMGVENNTTFYPVVLTNGPDLYISQVHAIYRPATLLGYSNSTFITYNYRIENMTYLLSGNESVKIPPLSSYGWGDEHSLLAGNLQVTYMDGTGYAIVDNYKSHMADTVNMTPEAMSESGGSIFVATISNSTMGIHEFNSEHTSSNLVFNYSSPIFGFNTSYSPITLSVLPDGLFLVNYFKQGGYYHNGTYVQSDCQLIALNAGGSVAWTYNYSSYPYLLQTGINGGNTLFISIYNYEDNAYFYQQAKFALVNYTDGQVLWSHTYMSSTSSNGGSTFLAPANYNGLLLVANGRALFNLGNSVEFANIP